MLGKSLELNPQAAAAADGPVTQTHSGITEMIPSDFNYGEHQNHRMLERSNTHSTGLWDHRHTLMCEYMKQKTGTKQGMGLVLPVFTEKIEEEKVSDRILHRLIIGTFTF